MGKMYYILLGLAFIAFFGVNYFIYSTEFVVSDKYKNISSVIQNKNINLNYPSILNFGDAMFDRGVRNIMENRERDPFEYIKIDLEKIKKYDIKILNLEGPIVSTDRKNCQQKAYNFQFATTTPYLLKSIGINIVNIANNHIFDCFSSGALSTKEFLKENNIDYIGDYSPDKSYLIKEIDGKIFGFIGIDRSISQISENEFLKIIDSLKKVTDYIIVNIHWGEEYNISFTEAQKNLAHKLIDSGATVVFGHHPHVVEPVEIYKNGVIFYSLGNFVFDQDFDNTNFGIGVGVEFKEDGKYFEILPFNIKTFAPEFIKDPEKTIYCDKYLGDIEHSSCLFKI